MTRARAVAGLLMALCLFALPAHGSRTTPGATLTLRLISTPLHTDVKDVAPKGVFSKGDTYTGTDTLRNQVAQLGQPKGVAIGLDRFSIVFTSRTRAHYKVTVYLPAGKIRVDGEARVAANIAVLPVVGGAGAYAGARGTAEAHDLSGGRSLNIYRLQLP